MTMRNCFSGESPVFIGSKKSSLNQYLSVGGKRVAAAGHNDYIDCGVHLAFVLRLWFALMWTGTFGPSVWMDASFVATHKLFISFDSHIVEIPKASQVPNSIRLVQIDLSVIIKLIRHFFSRCDRQTMTKRLLAATLLSSSPMLSGKKILTNFINFLLWTWTQCISMATTTTPMAAPLFIWRKKAHFLCANSAASFDLCGKKWVYFEFVQNVRWSECLLLAVAMCRKIEWKKPSGRYHNKFAYEKVRQFICSRLPSLFHQFSDTEFKFEKWFFGF